MAILNLNYRFYSLWGRVFMSCFFCALTAFQSVNYFGFAVPALALIITFYMPYQVDHGSPFKELEGIIACYFRSIIIVLILSFFIRMIVLWVQSGKK